MLYVRVCVFGAWGSPRPECEGPNIAFVVLLRRLEQCIHLEQCIQTFLNTLFQVNTLFRHGEDDSGTEPIRRSATGQLNLDITHTFKN